MVNYKEYLAANGWRQGTPARAVDTFDDVWYLRVEDAPRCKCNPDKPLQVVAKVWDFHKYRDENPITIELEIRSQLPCGRWVEVSSLSFNADKIVEELPIAMKYILTGWRAIFSVSE